MFPRNRDRKGHVWVPWLTVTMTPELSELLFQKILWKIQPENVNSDMLMTSDSRLFFDFIVCLFVCLLKLGPGQFRDLIGIVVCHVQFVFYFLHVPRVLRGFFSPFPPSMSLDSLLHVHPRHWSFFSLSLSMTFFRWRALSFHTADQNFSSSCFEGRNINSTVISIPAGLKAWAKRESGLKAWKKDITAESICEWKEKN